MSARLEPVALKSPNANSSTMDVGRGFATAPMKVARAGKSLRSL